MVVDLHGPSIYFQMVSQVWELLPSLVEKQWTLFEYLLSNAVPKMRLENAFRRLFSRIFCGTSAVTRLTMTDTHLHCSTRRADPGIPSSKVSLNNQQLQRSV